jgi:murein DD-endopeptidase MepM/ murein hydrolase activator NlpD
MQSEDKNQASENSFFKNLTSGFTPVIDSTYNKGHFYKLDLSVNNRELEQIDLASSQAMEQYINGLLIKNNKKVAWGGYLEQRNIYKRSDHFNQLDAETERDIHLGIDLWVEAGTNVLAVCDGEILGFNDNDNFGDYGPTIILKHITNGLLFYSLYGHLSRKSLQGLEAGQKVKRGEIIGEVGYTDENGDYAPHLHFQVIKTIGGYKGDYPGVCAEEDIEYYINNCPDPNLLLKIENLE